MSELADSSKQAKVWSVAYFTPLFFIQFLGAFNDQLYKSAIVMMITFQLSQSDQQTGLLVTLAAGLFILPFFLFSAIAGQLADHFCKTTLIKKIKLAEIFIMLFGALGLWLQQLELLMIMLFLMGAQSTFFGPIKYAILPEVIPSEALLKGNAYFSGSTFIAILLGTIFGSAGILVENGALIMSLAVVGLAVIGYLFTFKLSPLMPSHHSVRIEANIFKSSWRIIEDSRHYPRAFFAVLAISWFWFIGSVFLTQIPTLVKYHLLADDQVVIAFLTAFSVGVAMGTGLVSFILKGQVVLKWHALVLGLMSVVIVALVALVDAMPMVASSVVHTEPVLLTNLFDFIGLWPQNLTLGLMFLLAMIGGVYIVPLYTLLQTQTPEAHRARMVAVNNILNAFYMVVSSLALMFGFALSLSLLNMLLLLALINLAVAGWFYKRHQQLN